MSFRRRIGDPDLRALYDYWLVRRDGAAAMPRARLDPVEIPQLLKNLILADVADGGHAISYRLVGTEIVAAHDLDYTGLTVEQLTGGETLAFTRALYERVVTQAVPVYSEGRFRWFDRDYHWTRRLHLPLTRDGSAVDMVLAGQVFVAGKARDREMLVPAQPEELAADLAEALAAG